jgi:hypothetical protein
VCREGWSAGPAHACQPAGLQPRAVGGRDGCFSFSFLDGGLVAVGLPLTGQGESGPIGLVGSLLMVAAFALAFWGSVRLVTWLDEKLGYWVLLRDIYRDLGIGTPRPRRKLRLSRPKR